MAFIIKDRVKEGTTTAGTGAFTLGGSSATFEPFNSYMADGDTSYYAVVHTTSGVDEWEVGLGTWNTGNTLTRTTVLSGSNGTSVVDFAAGTKDIFMTYPASKAVFLDANGDVAIPSDLDISGSLDVGESLEVETHIDIKTTVGNKPSHAEGRIFYDAAFGALAVYNDEADITLQVGQEEYIRVKNNTGSTVTNGTPVYLTGVDSSTPTIAVARADNNQNESQAVGIATHDIETNSVGYITVRGLIADVNTSHLTVGEKVHVGIGASGGTQTASPTYPNYSTEVGICLISAASGGVIYVHTQTEALETLRVTGNSHFDANVTVAGDLTVLGNQTIASTSNVSISNAFNYFNSGDTIGALNTAFTGSGLDDMSLTGHFTGTTTTNYYIRIDSVGGGTGGVDTFEWSTDNFTTFVAQDVDITANDQLIHSTDNIAVNFNATTGHTLGDVWTGTGSPINVDTGFASNRNTGTSGIGYTHLGIFYDVSTNKWTVFDEYSPEPSGTIDVGHSSFSYGALKAGTFEGNLDGDVTGNLVGNSSGQHNGSVVGNVTGNVTGNLTGSVTGNADTASTLATARTVQLTGDVIGSASFDGSASIAITATVQDDSHAHIIANVDGLQTALDAKADDSTTITAGNGLTGGGSLGANRTISHSDTSSQASLVALTGAAVVSDVDLDTYGHVTNLTTRNLTLANLGYTGATNANNFTYTHPTHPGDDAGIDTGVLSGATVISDLDLNIFTDTLGHVTDANATVGTRNLTLADLGYTGETNATADQTAAQLLTAVKTVDGAGSGLDSDTVDGLQANQFLRSDSSDTHTGTLTLDVVEVGNELRFPNNTSVADVSLTGTSDQDTGFNWSGSNAVNYVSGGVLKYNLNNVWHSGNDGSGSGLDADTVDGVHESTFMRRSANSQLDMNNDNIVGVNALIHEGDSDTYIQFHASNEWRVVTGGVERLEVNNANITMAATLQMASHNIDMNNNHIVGARNIYHEADSDTYMGFHAADQFQVVTGGTERLEVNNSAVTVAGTFNNTSDARLKENVEPLTNALSDVCKLEGVSFNWIDGGKKSTGFIAQQVEPILPDVVTTNEDDGIKSVNYVGMIGHLVEAIKEQQAQIDELKQKLNG